MLGVRRDGGGRINEYEAAGCHRHARYVPAGVPPGFGPMTDLTNRWLWQREICAMPRARLFCFPYAGVGPSAYRLWHGAFPAGTEVSIVQLPGREARLREPAFTDMAPLVEALTGALRPRLDVPFVFFGHSMGALLAAEVARSLAAQGAPTPIHLVVSGRRAPHLPDPSPRLSTLDDESFLAEIGRRYGGIPAAILADREMLALLLPGLRADIAALESYVHRSELRLSCPITVLGGTRDVCVPVDDLQDWQELTTGPVRVRTFPGDHFYLNAHRAEVIGEVTAALAPLLSPRTLREHEVVP
jgi:medium-chain acyl-[acyl-carrier-protein] hydrolase